ncbi:mRNA splicing protein [Martiniozyma asiatica (nom. inval.)]|nr:mRNA splicing protein [Martiniozyma asiatica]
MVSAPELKNYVGQKIRIDVQGRIVEGTLVGYDMFLNLNLQSAVERDHKEIVALGQCVIRGSSVVSIEMVQ